jgi:hypothetical protein
MNLIIIKLNQLSGQVNRKVGLERFEPKAEAENTRPQLLFFLVKFQKINNINKNNRCLRSSQIK